MTFCVELTNKSCIADHIENAGKLSAPCIDCVVDATECAGLCEVACGTDDEACMLDCTEPCMESFVACSGVTWPTIPGTE